LKYIFKILEENTSLNGFLSLFLLASCEMALSNHAFDGQTLEILAICAGFLKKPYAKKRAKS